MQEKARNQRNTDRLAECYPWFAVRLQKVIVALEGQEIRPRIQDAWRSPADQLKAYNSGHSKLRYGFHNATGGQGQKEALAVDLLDDDSPTEPSTRYLIALAIAARAAGLSTGITWGLPAKLRVGVEDAIATGNLNAPVKVGWDPCHVEIVGLTPKDVEQGRRPS